MENKMTAVEWLIKQIKSPMYMWIPTHEWIEKAKAMEKEQIQKAYSEGYNFGKYGEESDRSGVAI
jgi:NaMN:DMB phosphoribosyltransferase